ncbi:MAG: DUF4332 domain-containing protein [Anaerolineales bacterium]|nr:DUF4332 domain-containing protein [Anaerolineales bacterium]
MINNILSQSNASPWWLWLIIIVLIIILLFLIWWWLGRSKAEIPETPVEVPARALEELPLVPDNLEIVEGIGPKIAGLLKDAGITTFKQLAETDVSRLEKILDEANLRIADPASWPEQAGLAAAGKMDELKALQDALKGGRKV